MGQLSDQLKIEIHRTVSLALTEDVGTGDLTTQLVPADRDARGVVVSREAAVICGTDWFNACFLQLDPHAQILWHVKDGERIEPNQVLCEVEAETRSLLTAERTALNFLQLLSATATNTRQYVDAIAGTRSKIVDTRKTLPGLRLAQKYAVACGGGANHRLGLWDAILVKENHVMRAGGIREALEQANAVATKASFVQIEVENLGQLEEALAAGAKMILLDNMELETMRKAVKLTAGRAELEASGGVKLERVRAIAETGVDRISIGSITKDIKAIDLSLRHVEA